MSGEAVTSSPRRPTRHDVHTHCPRGHRYTKKNTCVLKSGSKDCRACRLARVQRDRPNNGIGRGGHGRAITHCPAGHKYTPANTRHLVDKYGHRCRKCRACELARATAGYWRNRSIRLAYSAERWARLKPTINAAQRRAYGRAREAMTPAYVALILGMPIARIPCEMIALKQAHLAAKRLLESKTPKSNRSK